MLKFIDIHGHYAWDIDDGIPQKEEAKKALKKASQQGIYQIVATPHITCGKITKDEYQKILNRIDDLKKLGKMYHIHIQSGCELMLNENVDETLDQELFIPIENTKYILCEYDLRKSTDDFIEEFDGYLLEIISRGYIPVVAHIERYFHSDIDLDFVRYLIDVGCIIQVNTTSVLGLGHQLHHQFALKLLDQQLVHIIASDTHRADGIRSPNMKECYYYMYKKGYQRKYIDLLEHENPKRVVNDGLVMKPKFKKRFFLMGVLHKIRGLLYMIQNKI